MSRESQKSKKARMGNIVALLKQEYPDSKCSLNYDSPFQLLVSTILSAQCTDARVNKVTSKIYKRYKNPSDFSKPVESNSIMSAKPS